MADHPPPLRPALRRPGQPPRQIPRRVVEGPPEASMYKTRKLLLIAALGCIACLLGLAVAILQRQVDRAHQRLLEQRAADKNSHGGHAATSSGGSIGKTQVPSDPTQAQDLYLWQQPQSLPDSSRSRRTAAQAYWNQFQGISPAEAKPWSPLEEPTFDFRRALTSNNNNDFSSKEHLLLGKSAANNAKATSIAETKLFVLKRAAQLGHPEAQHVYANALASGVLPLHYDQTTLLTVADEFLQTDNDQLQEAWLNWHMAATSGHVEAAMALAHRYDTLRQPSGAAPWAAASKAKRKAATDAGASSKKSFTCYDVLPYYQAAAHGIIDKLEASPHSRAKVAPPMEKHLLYQVHLHGGTSSQLDRYNKPDESMEAIQFYHFKATRPADPDPYAAITLATLYHYGSRGVIQNLTLALQYYDVAAQAGSWEAAGVAGWFHVFGLGMTGKERDLFQAHKYFQQGIVEGGLKACQELHQKKKPFKSKDTIPQCDAGCLNGMGLLHVFGVPLVVAVDLDAATEYFTLAKEMGHPDAAYNMAMVTLGWKSHYVSLEEAIANQPKIEIRQDGVLQDSFTPVDLPSFMEDSYHMAAGPSPLDMQHGVQQLMFAVQEEHLQAVHRLALLYDTGVLSTPDEKTSRIISRRPKNLKLKEILPQDCEKALKHYKWIVDRASPHVQHRLRTAYKDYIAGDAESSLIQYMSIAELGNEIAQVNAAFLLEQGTCLGLDSTDCHRAAVRFWKAAAAVGNAEACLRVGDFYYYGKLRAPDDLLGGLWNRPFGWVQFMIFPEKYLLPALVPFAKNAAEQVSRAVLTFVDPDGARSLRNSNKDELDENGVENEAHCEANSEEGSCSATPEKAKGGIEGHRELRAKKRQEENERDLKMAAHYYRIAADRHASPRANFNLAYLHEWGLGLTQDFPLAKRHYDLAASSVVATREADLAVQIALWTLVFHEYLVRIRIAWEDYWSYDTDIGTLDSPVDAGSTVEAVPKAISSMIGRPVPGGPSENASFMGESKTQKTKMDIIWAHLWSWESLFIVILTIVLWILLQRRRQRTRR
jgi:TPR repeat protein